MWDEMYIDARKESERKSKPHYRPTCQELKEYPQAAIRRRAQILRLSQVEYLDE